MIHYRDTHTVSEAIRSASVMLNPALYFMKSPIAVSNETSAPTVTAFVPTTPERLTMGLAVNPILALTPA